MGFFETLQELVTSGEIQMPLAELVAFMVLVSVFFLLGRRKLGLITILCFLTYWAFILNMQTFYEYLKDTPIGLPAYGFLGILLIGLICTAFFMEN